MPVGKEKYIHKQIYIGNTWKEYYDPEIERNLMQALTANTSLKF